MFQVTEDQTVKKTSMNVRKTTHVIQVASVLIDTEITYAVVRWDLVVKIVIKKSMIVIQVPVRIWALAWTM